MIETRHQYAFVVAASILVLLNLGCATLSPRKMNQDLYAKIDPGESFAAMTEMNYIGIGHMEPDAAACEAIKYLDHPNWVIRYLATTVLVTRSGAGDSEAIQRLTISLDDNNWIVRAGAATALGVMGNEANCAIPKLIKNLSHERWELRRNAAWALSRMQVCRSDVESSLNILLKDNHPQVRMAARELLRKIKSRK